MLSGLGYVLLFKQWTDLADFAKKS